MPVFLLLGGELVIAFLLARIAVWVLRGWREARQTPIDPGPGGGGGFRAPAPGRRRARRTPPMRPRRLPPLTRRRVRAA